jgi:hypothetical protein
MKNYIIAYDDSQEGMVVVGKIKKGIIRIKEIEEFSRFPSAEMANRCIREFAMKKKDQYKAERVFKGRRVPLPSDDFKNRFGLN